MGALTPVIPVGHICVLKLGLGLGPWVCERGWACLRVRFLSPRFAVVCRSHRRCRPLLARFGPALGKGRGLRPTQALECRRVVHLVPRAPLRAPDLVDAGIVRPLCLRFEYRRLRFVHRRLRFQGCPLFP